MFRIVRSCAGSVTRRSYSIRRSWSSPRQALGQELARVGLAEEHHLLLEAVEELAAVGGRHTLVELFEQALRRRHVVRGREVEDQRELSLHRVRVALDLR